MDTAFVVSKILPLILYPIGLICVGTVASTAFAIAGWRRTSIFYSLVVIVVAMVSSTPYFPNKVGWLIEKRFLPLEVDKYPRADVIIVLGGGISPRRSPELSPAINSRGDRFFEASRLYHASRAPFVLLTGGDGLEVTVNGQISNDGVKVLSELGVPNDVIIAENESRTTEENAKECLKILKQRNFNVALLVTSAIHMPRAVATFKSAGVDVIAAPTDYRFSEKTPDTPLLWYPRVEAMLDSSAIVREYLGFAVYRWRGAIGTDYGYLIDS